jgi:hypothetical protein
VPGTPDISGGGTFTVNGGTMTVGTAMNAENLALVSGTIDGAGALTVTNSLVWSGGTMSGAGSTSVDAAASFSLSGSQNLITRSFTTASAFGEWSGNGTFTLDGATFTNDGTIVVTGDGTLARNNPGVFINNGLFEKQSGGGATTFSGNTLTFTNSSTGTLRVSGGTLSADSTFNNRGLVQVFPEAVMNVNGSGSGGGDYAISGGAQVNLTGGTQTFDTTGGTPSITGNGPFRIVGGTMTVSTDMNADRLTLASGALNGANALTIERGLIWSGGTMSGTGSTSVDSEATFALSGSPTLTTRAFFTASTTGVWSGDGTVTLDGATFTNTGTLTASGNGTITRNAAGSAFVNAGLFDKNGGAGTTTFLNSGLVVANSAAGTIRVTTGTLNISSAFDNEGEVDVAANRIVNIAGNGQGGGDYAIAAGGQVNFTSGTQIFNTTGGGTPDISGAGVFTIGGGTLGINIPMSADNLALTSGRLEGNAALTIDNSLNWSGGTMSGIPGASTTVSAAATLTLSGSTTLTNRSFTNASTTGLWTGNGTFTIDGATFTNNGTITATGNGTLTGNNPAVFLNTGTFDKNGGMGATTFSANALTFTNTGTTRVSTGTLQVDSTFNNRGLVEIAANAVMNINGSGSGGGVYEISSNGQVNLTGGTQIFDATGGPPQIRGGGLFSVNGGTMTVNEPLSAVNFALVSGIVDGTADLLLSRFEWSGGTMGGTGTTTVPGEGGGMTLSGSPTLIGRTLVNDGFSTWSGNGTFTLDNATFTNNASFQIVGDGIMTANAASSFVNNGELSKAIGTGTTSFQGPLTLSNTTFGTVRVETGVLEVTGGFAQNGTLAVAAGAIFARPAGFTNNGTITGNGTIDVGANAVSNTGTLSPGDSPGTLEFVGDLELAATGTTQIEIQAPGTTFGTDYDRINVTGQVRGAPADRNNWGTLEVTHLGGFVPATGSGYTIMSHTSSLGDFSTKNFPQGFGYTGTPNPANYALFLNTITNSWILDGNGDWSSPANWALGVAPRADHRIVIDRPAGDFTITVPAGAFTADRVTSTEKLVLDGGTLSLANPSTIGNMFTVNNGVLQGAADVTVNGPFVFNGGTLANTGGFTVNGTSTVSGAAQLGTTFTTGILNVTGGTLDIGAAGALRVVDNAVSTIASGASVVASGPFALAGATLNNDGTIRLAGGDMRLNDGAIVNNAGSFVFQSDADIEHTVGAAPAFNNTGTLSKTGGTGVSIIGAANAFPVTNAASATIDVQTGTLQVNAFPVNDGTISTVTGATFSTNGAALTNNGTIMGTGTLALGGATLFNDGTLSPGASPGTMVIDGDYVQGPAGRLLIELGGHDQGVTYDLLRITGDAALDGTLDVVTVNGFNPEPGDRFAFMTYAARNGDFSTLNVPPGDNFQSTAGSSAYGIDTLAAAPPPSPPPTTPTPPPTTPPPDVPIDPTPPAPPGPPASTPAPGVVRELVAARSTEETTRLAEEFVSLLDTRSISEERQPEGRSVCQ